MTVECTYDTMGRRATKKVTTNGTLTEHRRFLYRGYLQIACCDLTRAYTPALWFILWDPTQPTAPRPLAIQKNGTWYTYGWDLTKNICETYRTDGRIDLAYTYTPYGEVSPAHAYDQPLRWSSEYHDTELGLVYYNYRHYNPAMGRWLGRDMGEDMYSHNIYDYSANAPCTFIDNLGLNIVVISGGINISNESDNHDSNWRNFIDAVILKINEIKNSKCFNETIEWFVQEKSYVERYENDKYEKYIRNALNKFPTPYIKIIADLAKQEGVLIRWFVNADDFRTLIALSPDHRIRTGEEKIHKLYYFGHGYVGALSISDQKGSQKLYGYDFVNLASSFVKSPIIKFTTCHSASHPICGGNSLIEDVYAGLQGYIYGYDGRADYAPVASDRPPMRGTSIDETKAIIDNKLIIPGEKALPRHTPYKVYSIRIPREQK